MRRLAILALLAACREPEPPPPPPPVAIKTVVVGEQRTEPPPEPSFPVPIDERLDARPDPGRWKITGETSPAGGALGLMPGAAVASALPLDFARPRTIAVDVDVKQGGTAAGLVLTPRLPRGAPREDVDWLSVGWVPIAGAGRVRLAIEGRAGGRYRAIELFGWPADRTGAEPGKHRLSLTASGAKLLVLVDQREVYQSADTGFPLARAHLSLAAWSAGKEQAPVSFSRLHVE